MSLQKIKIETELQMYQYADIFLHHLYQKNECDAIEYVQPYVNLNEKTSLNSLLDKNDLITIKKIMLDNEFIMTAPTKNLYYEHFKIASKGIMLIKNNKTIEQYFNELGIKEKEHQEAESFKRKKLYFDSKLSKLKYYTFWPLIAISILGFILSIYNLLK